MKYIKDTNKLAKIKELANNGDEKAKDFLFNFMEMTDDEANEYLLSIDADNNEWDNIIDTLIKDENEAIDGYDKAIKYAVNNGLPTEVLEHIREQEIEHIEELKELLNDGNKD